MEKLNFLADLADILEVDKEDLVDDYVLDNQGKWDSLAIVATIALIDEQFNTTIPGDMLRDCNSIGQLWVLVQNGKAK